MQTTRSEVTAAYLTYAEASELIGVKIGTLYAWVSRRMIPFVRLSPRVVRFRRADIDAWLQERSIPASQGCKERPTLGAPMPCP